MLNLANMPDKNKHSMSFLLIEVGPQRNVLKFYVSRESALSSNPWDAKTSKGEGKSLPHEMKVRALTFSDLLQLAG